MASKKPLKAKELFKKLRRFGVVSLEKRGKGSERILLKPKSEGSTQGPQYPVKYHGPGTEITVPVILAILRRFGIDPEDFWD